MPKLLLVVIGPTTGPKSFPLKTCHTAPKKPRRKSPGRGELSGPGKKNRAKSYNRPAEGAACIMRPAAPGELPPGNRRSQPGRMRLA